MSLSGYAFSAGVAAMVLTTSCSKSSGGGPPRDARSEGTPVSVAQVVTVPMDRTLPVVGTLFAKDEATIAARVEGQVEQTLVDFGDRVTKGQMLARIDTASYEALARQAAANLAKAKASAANAEQDLKRVRDLQQDKIASASDFDKAMAVAEQARAEVKAVAAAEAIAQLNLERSQVKAPFDGAVAERIASAGDYMKTGESLFRLVNDGVLKFIVQVPERYAAQVRKEQPMRFTVDAWPGEVFEGRVYLIGPAVNISSRSFNVGALVANPDRRLKASTFGRGELILEKAVPTPVIPLEAVVNFAGVMKVFVIENGVARARPIEVGRVNDSKQEVLSGLKAGETVAASGQSKLYDGAPVRVREGEQKSEIRNPKFEARTREAGRGSFASLRSFGDATRVWVGVAASGSRQRMECARFIAAFGSVGQRGFATLPASTKAVLKHTHSKRWPEVRSLKPECTAFASPTPSPAVRKEACSDFEFRVSSFEFRAVAAA